MGSLSHVSAGAAFAAGLMSFLSPCVLPLVPGYLSFMSGLELDEMSHGRYAHTARKAGLGSIFFVLGFTTVFTALGASASEIGELLASHLPLLSRFAGAVIVLFGLHTSGLIPIRLFYYEKRMHIGGFSHGYGGSFLMGIAFAFGWTPCIGPILAAILALAATQQTVAQGVFLLILYSFGLGIPFIATGFGLNYFLAFFKRYRPFLRAGEVASGLLLIAVGALVFTNRLTYLIRFVPGFFKRFAL